MLLMCLCAPPARPASPEDARRAYDAGHFTDAMGIWSELSRSGNAEAAFGLGLLFDLGNGTKADPQTAFLWYKMAAEAGLPEAEFNVAAMYDSGRGVTQSSATAALWYAKAAAHGHHRAEFDLGQLYQQGDGVPRNPDAAAAWLQAAADGGITAAATRLKALTASPEARPSGPIADVTLAAPGKDARLTLTGSNPAVELVWTAPPEPQPVHYEVQVNELGSTLHTVFSASVTTTAVLVSLPTTPDLYVWSVDTVGRDGSHVPGDLNWFSIVPTEPSEQSVASMPQGPRPIH